MNWNITLSLISGALIQLLGETHAICNHPSRASICRDNNLNFDAKHEICFLKKTYTNGGIAYERGGTNETMCKNNAALSSLRNPDCKSSHPPVNTVCYDCCIANCAESRFCNQVNDINPTFMPSYMQTGPGQITASTLPTTSSTSSTTTLPTTSSTSTTTTITAAGKTHAVCSHQSTKSTCITTSFGIDVHHVICFLKKTYTNGGITYERGGTDETMCMKNAAHSSLNNPDCKLPFPPVNTVCYDCCYANCPDSRFCNQKNVINPIYILSYMHTGLGPTTSTTSPTTSATTTILPSTSSSSTTTTTSAAVNGTKCLVCIEDHNNSCSSVDYTVCSDVRPHCLNEIIYHNGKWTKTLHRCASEVECYWDYWIGTGNGTECIQNGVCAYCCQGSNGKPCNAVTEKPTSLSNFGQPQNRAYKCVVTGPQNGNTIQDCPLSERFCLNDVIYDTDPNTNNLITRDVRRCATQEQCKGKWLQSKNINACLTGNMTGVDASKIGNMLLCHYCCESNTMTPCNLHPKPDQINLFIQPTTLPVVSSTAVCQDKPGVDCSLLNATNICANPAAQQYCAAFCGHC